MLRRMNMNETESNKPTEFIVLLLVNDKKNKEVQSSRLW